MHSGAELRETSNADVGLRYPGLPRGGDESQGAEFAGECHPDQPRYSSTPRSTTSKAQNPGRTCASETPIRPCCRAWSQPQRPGHECDDRQARRHVQVRRREDHVGADDGQRRAPAPGQEVRQRALHAAAADEFLERCEEHIGRGQPGIEIARRQAGYWLGEHLEHRQAAHCRHPGRQRQLQQDGASHQWQREEQRLACVAAGALDGEAEEPRRVTRHPHEREQDRAADGDRRHADEPALPEGLLDAQCRAQHPGVQRVGQHQQQRETAHHCAHAFLGQRALGGGHGVGAGQTQPLGHRGADVHQHWHQ